MPAVDTPARDVFFTAVFAMLEIVARDASEHAGGLDIEIGPKLALACKHEAGRGAA